jgi:hypothetical protein
MEQVRTQSNTLKVVVSTVLVIIILGLLGWGAVKAVQSISTAPKVAVGTGGTVPAPNPALAQLQAQGNELNQDYAYCNKRDLEIFNAIKNLNMDDPKAKDKLKDLQDQAKAIDLKIKEDDVKARDLQAKAQALMQKKG